MELTEQTERFDRGYRDGEPPWVIGEAQPAVVELERSGGFRGTVLDIGCGAGEHTLLLAGLGYDVLGADASPTALDRARAAAAERGVPARFTQVDALDPVDLGQFDTILDSALFHVFDEADRSRYASALLRLCAPGAVLHVLALARTDGPAFGPVIPRSAIEDTFAAPGWEVQEIGESTYRGVVFENVSEDLGLPVGARVDVPAWLARIHRVGELNGPARRIGCRKRSAAASEPMIDRPAPRPARPPSWPVSRRRRDRESMRIRRTGRASTTRTCCAGSSRGGWPATARPRPAGPTPTRSDCPRRGRTRSPAPPRTRGRWGRHGPRPRHAVRCTTWRGSAGARPAPWTRGRPPERT